MRTFHLALGGSIVVLNVARVSDAATPVISPAFASRYQVTNASPVGDLPLCTQMTFGPDGRLYVTNAQSNVSSYAYNPTTGALTDKRSTGVQGFGIAFATHSVPGGVSQTYMYLVRNDTTAFEGSIARVSDTNGNGVWGEAGEVNVDIVRNIPIGDHTLDHLAISGNQLYVGIGCRTNNGRNGDYSGQSFHDTPAGAVAGGFSSGTDTGFTYGDTSYNGAIATIRDLSLVGNTTSAAQLRDGPNGTSGNLLGGRDAFLLGAPHASLPYTSTANDKLVVHSAGTRNPFGLAVDSSGDLWFTNNYSRSDTNGNGTSTPHFKDLLDSDFSNDVADQFFHAVAGGDYRYDNASFRGTPGFPTTTVVSTTFDNLDSSDPRFGHLHDPANPDGLGPSSSSNGLDFDHIDLTGLMATDSHEYAVIARWNSAFSEEAPGTDTLDYRDVVVVDPATGKVRRLAENFDDPIDVVSDGHGGYLVADWGFNATIWRISPIATTSRWGAAGGGTWSVAGNWTGPVPNSVGAVANFTGAIASDAIVIVDAPRTLGTLNFDNAHRYTVAGSATITIDVAAGYGAVNVMSGTHAILAPLALADATTFTVTPATSTLAVSNLQTSSVAITKEGAGTLLFSRIRAGTLNVNAGTVAIAPGSGSANSLALISISPGASLDLTDNDLILTATPKGSVESHVASKRLYSSLSTLTSATRIGVLDGAEYLSFGNSNFDGVPVAASDVVVKYTWNGDANFDGRVTFDDYVRIDTGFNAHRTGWANGDFNHDGAVNFDDYVLIDIAFNQQNGTLSRAVDWISGDDRSGSGRTATGVAQVVDHFERFGASYALNFLASVPEPGCGSILLVGALARRRRRQYA